MRRALPLVFILCLMFLPGQLAKADGPVALRVESIIVETATGKTKFEAEIADTPERRAIGLMFRDSMPANRGMLFDFGKPRVVSMWMKNTKLSLDMIFADNDGRIVGIAANTVPFSEDIISVKHRVRAVLEVNAGTTERIGLKVGGRIIHPIFGRKG